MLAIAQGGSTGAVWRGTQGVRDDVVNLISMLGVVLDFCDLEVQMLKMALVCFLVHWTSLTQKKSAGGPLTPKNLSVNGIWSTWRAIATRSSRGVGEDPSRSKTVRQTVFRAPGKQSQPRAPTVRGGGLSTKNHAANGFGEPLASSRNEELAQCWRTPLV